MAQMTMPAREQKVWIELRAKLIQQWHEIHNPGKFIGGFKYESAVKIAENQLEYDLLKGELRITLEEMLLQTDSDCLHQLEQVNKDKIKELLAK